MQCVQARAAQSTRDHKRQLDTVNTQLQVMTDRLNQVQQDAHALRTQLQHTEQAKLALQKRLDSGQGASQAELEASQLRCAELDKQLRNRLEHVRSLQCELRQMEQQRATLESTIGSLVAINDEMHTHVQQV